MKTNTFEEKLYALADDFSNIEMNARFHNADWLVYAITDLVLNDVINKPNHCPYSHCATETCKHWEELRVEQRAIIKGGNHED